MRRTHQATHRYTLPGAPPRDERDLLVARLWQADALGVWEQDDATVAWFDRRDDGAVPHGGRWEVEEPRDWLSEWKRELGTVRVGRIVIAPSWIDHSPLPDDITLLIDPEQAFGTGHHATTRRCLELLQSLEVVAREVLDVGTGSGILALAAERLGASRTVGIDTDPTAVEVAAANAARNAVTPELRVGSVEVAETTFDLVLANLVTGTILDLASDLVAVTRPDGHLILSGIRADRGPEVIELLAQLGTVLLERVEEDGWLALLLSRPATAGASP